MVYLRHAARHVHRTVVDHLTAGLDELGWLTDGQTPFDVAPLTIRSTRPFKGEGLAAGINAGTVCITLGNEQGPDEQELGGPLVIQEYPFFVDVFADTEAVALAICSDIKDLLLGRIAGYGRGVGVVDQVTATPVAGMVTRFEDIERVSPDHSFPLHWQVVHCTAAVQFNDEVWG